MPLRTSDPMAAPVRPVTRRHAGIARYGGHVEHGSGEFAIAFSTASSKGAIVESLLRASTLTCRRDRAMEALPVDRVLARLDGSNTRLP